MTRFVFTIAASDGAARTGAIAMQRGEIRTPAFMPVGTAATVKAMKPADVRASGADIILGNTYHLMLRPGAERVALAGTSWSKAMQMSEPSSRWISIERSGESMWRDPSRWLAKATPSSATFVSPERLITW